MARNWKNVENEWKKLAPKDKSLIGAACKMAKEYDRKAFLERVSGPPDAVRNENRFIEGFNDWIKTITKVMGQDKKLVEDTKVKTWLQTLVKDLTEEYKFWKGHPGSKSLGDKLTDTTTPL
jgi:hypothetical protein